MKKSLKLLILSAAIFLVGSVIFGAGFLIFRDSNARTVEHHTFIESGEINRIVCDLDEYRINFHYSSRADSITVEYPTIKNASGDAISYSTVYAEDGTLYIKGETNELLSIFDFSNDNERITVTIPASRKLDYDVKSSTGSITFGDYFNAENIAISSSTANVSIGGGHIARSLRIRIGTGDIRLCGNIHADEIIMTTSTGDVAIQNEIRSQTLKIETSSGKVLILEHTDSSKSIDIKTGTGDVKSAKPLFSSAISVRTATGDVSLVIYGNRELYTASVHAGTGKSNISSGGNGNRSIDISVSTGDVSVSFLEYAPNVD